MDFGANIVFASFLIVFLWLLCTIHLKRWQGEGAAVAWIILLIGALFVDDAQLKLAFWFSLPIALAMVFIADPYLVKRTLSYGHDDGSFLRKRIRDTPIWMALLWWLAATHMTYFCLRVSEIKAFFDIGISDFWFTTIVLFFGYFLPFEMLVNNFTSWWERRNCTDISGVAIYAMFAEAATVVVIYAFSTVLRTNIEEPLYYSLAIGLAAALLITAVFTFFCFMFYKKT